MSRKTSFYYRNSLQAAQSSGLRPGVASAERASRQPGPHPEGRVRRLPGSRPNGHGLRAGRELLKRIRASLVLCMIFVTSCILLQHLSTPVTPGYRPRHGPHAAADYAPRRLPRLLRGNQLAGARLLPHLRAQLGPLLRAKWPLKLHPISEVHNLQ